MSFDARINCEPLRVLFTCATLATLAQSVSAQAPDGDAAEEPGSLLEEVTVTAQRREQNLQDVPMAISAFNEEDLRVRQVFRMDDVGKNLPNVLIEPTPSSTNGAKIYIRGIGADESLFTADPAVAIYLDDVYVPRITGSLFALYDIERIEVLRGPQGTLYGRNATNGAVRFITRKPDGKPEFNVEGRFGNFSRTDFRVSGGGAISDTLSFRAGAMILRNDGWTRNLTTGSEVNDNDFAAARFSLTKEFGGGAQLIITADYLADNSTPWFPVGLGRDFPENNPDGDLFTFNSTLVPPDGLNEMDQYGVSATFTSKMGEANFTAIAAYRAFDWDFVSDFDGIDPIRLHLTQLQEQDNQSLEFRLDGASGPWTWVGGVYLFAESNFQPTRTDVFAIGATNIISQDTESYAGYFDATYEVTDRLRLTGGLRYSYEQKDFSVDSVTAGGDPNFQVQQKESWSTPTYRFVVDYDLTENVLGYVSYATGFKSGAFNGRGTTPAALTPVNEEEVQTIEGGIKSDWFNRRLRVNATYYFSVYEDLQVNALDESGVFTLVNAAEAEFSGIELEVSATPLPGLDLIGTLGTVDPKFTKARPGSGFDTSLVPKNAPELTWNVTANYVHAAFGGDMNYSANVSYTDAYFQNTLNSPTIRTDDHTLVNARIAYRTADQTWEIAAWGRNLTDEVYLAGGLYVGAIGVETGFINMPRTYGVDVTYRWAGN